MWLLLRLLLLLLSLSLSLLFGVSARHVLLVRRDGAVHQGAGRGGGGPAGPRRQPQLRAHAVRDGRGAAARPPHVRVCEALLLPRPVAARRLHQLRVSRQHRHLPAGGRTTHTHAHAHAHAHAHTHTHTRILMCFGPSQISRTCGVILKHYGRCRFMCARMQLYKKRKEELRKIWNIATLNKKQNFSLRTS